MRNQRNNYMPVPTKIPKTSPKTAPRLLVNRKSSSSQTERVVLVKEENLNFFPSSRFNQNDVGMRRDYIKAINYINSCHKFINAIIEKNNENKTNLFLLPMVTNYIPIFPHILGKKKKPKTEEAKKLKSGSTSQPIPEEILPIGDCEKNVSQDDKYADKVADLVKEHVQQFLDTLQEDMNKAKKKTNKTTQKQCKNLDIVKQRLEELSKICFLQKNINSCKQPPDVSENCSVILSDTDCEDPKKRKIKVTCYLGSGTSVITESSDIKSDSEFEINS